MMEGWNDGMMEGWICTAFPIAQRSGVKFL
jgi:hypothetical protein